jgi:hypothetical protein
VVVVLYAAFGVILAVLFSRLSRAAEATTLGEKRAFRATFAGLSGLDRSRGVVMKLSALFALDSFGGGFVIQSFAAYWFYLRYGVNPGTLGVIFFWANIFGGISALAASRLASRIGLINTMVATHLPSNILLILVPLMPTLPLAITVLLARFSISQMDVPTRQSYIMAVVTPEERSAAGGITGVARTLGAAISPSLRRLHVRPAALDQPALLHRRHVENRLRPAAVPYVHQGAGAGGAAVTWNRGSGRNLITARIPRATNSTSVVSCAIWKGGSDCVGATVFSAGTRRNACTIPTKTLK